MIRFGIDYRQAFHLDRPYRTAYDTPETVGNGYNLVVKIPQT